MRVLHVTRDYPPQNLGGMSTAVGGLCTASRLAGIKVGVVSFDAWRPKSGRVTETRIDDTDAVPVLRVGRLDDPMIGTFFAPDVVHIHDPMLLPSIKPFRAPRVLSVHVLHSALNALRGVPGTESATAQMKAFMACDAVVVATEYVRKRVPHEITYVIPWGTALHLSDYAPNGPVVSVSRFADVKGTAELFDLLTKVDRRAIVVGGIPDNRQGERKWLDRLPPQLHSRVELPGWLPRSSVSQLLGTASVFVSTSKIETFGQSVLEAMAHRRPVVVTDIPAHRELVGDAGSVTDDLLRAIDELLISPKRAAALGERARARVKERFTWSRVIEQWEKMYHEVVSRPV